MSDRWLLTDAEDEKLQGLTTCAQTIYMRLLRRYMDYSTGWVSVTRSTMKRAIEYIPDNGSNVPARRVADISNDYIRARIAELERVGLIELGPKKSRFDVPAFRCVLAHLGKVRLEKEPPRNPQEGTPTEPPGANADTELLSIDRQDGGTPNEPPVMNPQIPGNPVRNNSLDIEACARSRFAEFWALYPKKVGKAPSEAKWKAKGLDNIADRILADIPNRKSQDRKWLDGFVPNPLTYLTQERWNDEIEPRVSAPKSTQGKQQGLRRGGFSEIDYDQEARDMGFRTEVT